MLVDWLRRRNQITAVLSVKDLNGNTALHAAAQFGCPGTALDLAKMFHQTAVEKILEDKGAKESMDINIPLTTTDYVLTESTLHEKISRDYYYLTAQLILEMRNTILVVATLIVAATYQGVLQPPGGVYPSPDPETLVSRLHPSMGRRLLQLGDDTVLDPPRLLGVHVHYYTGISNMIYYMSLYAIVGAYVVKLLYYPVKALLVDEDWWLRGLSVKFANRFSGSQGKFSDAVMKMKKQHTVLRLN
ncbi:hypothetical protein SASPL_153486 [Salvia splendens]|uniref:PGG domain-containing protein n=1 Tax=Salvia splendens TaxID=180675 RepID=A0A8X8W5W4_SALSN|nr:hypothetical protein SASPL_153486 [Salvia splendens]